MHHHELHAYRSEAQNLNYGIFFRCLLRLIKSLLVLSVDVQRVVVMVLAIWQLSSKTAVFITQFL